jgi:large subunit ribosomal protein L4
MINNQRLTTNFLEKMRLNVLNIRGEQTGRTVELPADIFGIEPNEHAVYLAVKSYLAAQRQGTHSTKGRSQVTGSTRKLVKQKGTGGARKGDIKNPLFRGGGRMFGPKPHKYEINLNIKVKKLARKSALSAKAAAGSIVILEDFTFDAPKTKAFAEISTNLKLRKSLFVTGAYDKMLYLSARNTAHTSITPAQDLNTYQIMNAGTLVLAESSIDKIKASL